MEKLTTLRDNLLNAIAEAKSAEADANDIAEYQSASFWQGKANAYGEVVNELNEIIAEAK